MSPPPKHWVEWENAGGVNVVRFTTTTIRDDRIIRSIFEQVDQLLAETGCNQLILNFSGVEFFASYTIGKLVVLSKKLQPPTGRLALCCLTDAVQEIIDIMNLRKQFHIYLTEQEALESFT